MQATEICHLNDIIEWIMLEIFETTFETVKEALICV